MSSLLGFDVMRNYERLDQEKDCGVFVAIGDNSIRERVVDEVRGRYSDIIFPKLIHPAAVVSEFTKIGNGTVLMPNSVVGPNSSIGEFCILNTLSTIDHDSNMGAYSSLAPGVVAGGCVKIGRRSAICIGAVIKHGVVIGENCVIGANSYLNQSVESNGLYYGTPARLIRSRMLSDPYLN
jgi:sugar O-acyltransferase (sialic acid O-acetyltransferase NeuD family)